MSPITIRSWAAVGALAAAAFSPLAVQASPQYTVDFESAFTAIGPGQPDADYTEQGIRFTPVGGDATIGPSFCAAPDFCTVGNDSSTLSALNDATVRLDRASGGLFSLLSFDASFLPSPQIDYSGLIIRLALDGMTAGGAIVSQVVDLAGDGAGNFLFGNYSADPALHDLSSLTLGACFFDGSACVRGVGLNTNDAQFSIDNLTFVPEPASYGLVALSLFAVALTRRRQRASPQA